MTSTENFQVGHVSDVCCTTQGTARRAAFQHDYAFDSHRLPRNPAGHPGLYLVGVPRPTQSLEQLSQLIRSAASAMNQAVQKRGVQLSFRQRQNGSSLACGWPGVPPTQASTCGSRQCPGVGGGAAQLPAASHPGPQTSWDMASGSTQQASLAKASWGTVLRSFCSKSYVSIQSKAQVFESLSFVSPVVQCSYLWCSATAADWTRWQNHNPQAHRPHDKTHVAGCCRDVCLPMSKLPTCLALQAQPTRSTFLLRLIQHCPAVLYGHLSTMHVIVTRHGFKPVNFPADGFSSFTRIR